MQLTQKESSLIKELKGQEELCIEKYKKAANCAKDKQLSDLFMNLASIEQQHGKERGKSLSFLFR